MLFFDHRLGPNDFTDKVPRRFPTADLGGLIEDVRQISFWIQSQLQGNGTIKKMETPGQPIMARVRGRI